MEDIHGLFQLSADCRYYRREDLLLSWRYVMLMLTNSPPVLNGGCWLTPVDMLNGCRMVIVVVASVFVQNYASEMALQPVVR